MQTTTTATSRLSDRPARVSSRPISALALVMACAALFCAARTQASTVLGFEVSGDPHLKLFSTNSYPSATLCAKCHPAVYEEWRASAHAYASISPMFHKFDQKINDLAGGTVGTFCVRCHASVGTTMGEPREMPLWQRAPVSREGVTCITCHRIREEYSRVNGERRIEPGPIFDPMTGANNQDQLNKVLTDPAKYKVRTNNTDRGMSIHTGVFQFPALATSEFCVSCHQVAVYPGIKLEVVWDQYRGSPAVKKGITCQDCHMGKDPGLANG